MNGGDASEVDVFEGGTNEGVAVKVDTIGGDTIVGDTIVEGTKGGANIGW